MLTKQISHKLVDYWFDKTIEKYVPNTRQRFELETNLEIKPNGAVFTSDMTVLFHGSWGQNNNQVFCKIQFISTFDFATENLGEPMIMESIWLFIQHQYQLSINALGNKISGN
ncbi:MAG: hypothetical protein ACTHK8_18450 [Ginsengibacter sp.]